MKKCVLELCATNTDSSLQSTVTFFCFPKSEDVQLFHKWAEALKKPPEVFTEKESFVCSRHFRTEDFSLTENDMVLDKDAVPSLFLENSNSEDSDIEFIDVDKIKEEPDEYIDYSEINNFVPAHESTKDKELPKNIDEQDSEDGQENVQVNLPIGCEICCDFQMKLQTLKKATDKADELKAVTHDFEIHKQSHDLPIEKKFNCSDCGENFAWANELRRHKINIHGLFKCDLCHKRYIKLQDLKQHKQFKHNIIDVYNCEFCNTSFFKVKELQKHLKTHQTKHKCDRCHKGFDSTELLKNHKCIERPFTCSICNNHFRAKTNLDHHKAKYHSVKLGPVKKSRTYPCKICSKKFKNEQSVDAHMKLHSKTYKCNVCGKRFKVESHRKYHELAHTGMACYNLGKLKC